MTWELTRGAAVNSRRNSEPGSTEAFARTFAPTTASVTLQSHGSTELKRHAYSAVGVAAGPSRAPAPKIRRVHKCGHGTRTDPAVPDRPGPC
jgi:hypothetical protein